MGWRGSVYHDVSGGKMPCNAIAEAKPKLTPRDIVSASMSAAAFHQTIVRYLTDILFSTHVIYIEGRTDYQLNHRPPHIHRSPPFRPSGPFRSRTPFRRYLFAPGYVAGSRGPCREVLSCVWMSPLRRTSEVGSATIGSTGTVLVI